MHNEIFINDLYLSHKYITDNSLFPTTNTISVIGENIISETLKGVLSLINDNKTKYEFNKYDNALHLDVTDNTTYIYFLDSEEQINLVDLKVTLDKISVSASNSFVLCTKLPNLPYIDFSEKIAEMELSLILENSIVTDIDLILKEYKNKLNIYQLRYDNLFGNEIEKDGKTNIYQLCKSLDKTNIITINHDDEYKYFSAISIPDLIDSIFTVICNGKSGNTYNVSSGVLTEAIIKRLLFDLTNKFNIQLSFDNTNSKLDKIHHSTLTYGKISSLGYKPVCSIEKSIYYSFIAHLNPKYNIQYSYINNQYDGKIDRIRNIELNALSIFDQICKDNDIKYFLSGGSMLGAVRHKGFIPWDDDVDVAMLRPEYEKFKKAILNMNLNEYVYQNHAITEGYHFFFDKITNSNTYFATKYSDEYDMLKGISLDIFVFDNVPASAFKQKIHYKKLMLLRKVINVRWKNRPRKGKLYFLTKLLLPILRLFSLEKLTIKYDSLTRKYESIETDYVLPPATDEKFVGGMPTDWFNETIDAQFENINSFIPKGYDGYLKLWYGENYNDLLPISQRESSHNFYRLDLSKDINKNSKMNFNNDGEII